MRFAATTGTLLDAFDALVAAQSDVAIVRDAPQATALLRALRSSLRTASIDLSHLAITLLTTDTPRLPPDHKLAVEAMRREAVQLADNPDVDPRAEAALGATSRRVVVALGHIGRLERELSDESAAAGSMTGVNLALFLPKRNYSLLSLRTHLTLASPVFRFALRLSLAMMAGSVIALSLSEAGHGNWILLTIAVVMRAGHGLTKKRRDDRIIGTMAGCLLAVGAVGYLPPAALVAVQGLGVGLAHGFARLNYRISSTGASIMALVSLHLAQPWAPAPVLTRLADTLIGAALAHLFNYVWPYWEFAEAPQIASQAGGPIAGFRRRGAEAQCARAGLPDGAQEHGRGACGALGFGRTHEHRTDHHAQGLDEMAALLMATHGLVSQLSAARLDTRTGVAPPPDEATRRWLKATLVADADRAPLRSPPPPGPITAAAVATMAAARRYREVAAAEEGL